MNVGQLVHRKGPLGAGARRPGDCRLEASRRLRIPGVVPPGRAGDAPEAQGCVAVGRVGEGTTEVLDFGGEALGGRRSFRARVQDCRRRVLCNRQVPRHVASASPVARFAVEQVRREGAHRLEHVDPAPAVSLAQLHQGAIGEVHEQLHDLCGGLIRAAAHRCDRLERRGRRRTPPAAGSTRPRRRRASRSSTPTTRAAPHLTPRRGRRGHPPATCRRASPRPAPGPAARNRGAELSPPTSPGRRRRGSRSPRPRPVSKPRRPVRWRWPTAMRLVARTEASGQRSRTRSSSARTPSATCSQLSKMRSVGAMTSRCSIVDKTSPPASSTPRTAPTASGTRSGSLTTARSTHHAPPGWRGAAGSAATIARLVLPMPPGPTRVTNRSDARSRARAAMSSSRPTRGAGSDGRLWLTTPGDRSGGKSARSPRRRDLVQHHRVVEPSQPELAQSVIGPMVGRREPGGRGGHHDLVAVAGGRHASGLVDGERDVVPVDDVGEPRVQSHPDAERVAAGPLQRGKLPLRLDARPHGRRGIGEGREEAVALGLHDAPAVAGDGPGHEAVVELQLGRVAVAQPVVVGGRPFDVREQERHLSRGKGGHQMVARWCRGPGTGASVATGHRPRRPSRWS